MHQSRPYGLHAIGLPLTDKDEAFVSNIAARITNLKELSGIDSMKMVYDLPDGGYVIVQDMGGNFRVISHKPAQIKEVFSTGIATDYMPMLFSGVITKPIVYEHEPVGLKLTEGARYRLTQYGNPDIPKPPADIELQRFRIEYDYKFQEFNADNASSYLRTQYVQQKPTWYSGAMSEVMQIVGGYGRQDFSSLPDEYLERSRVKLPLDVSLRINEELNGLRLPGFTGAPQLDGSFQYDYKFNNTHGVGFDNAGKPWLLQIGPSGVWAMPLPIVPATTTIAFREYIEDVNDFEVIKILDRFGGMPSGEVFPIGQAFEAWRRAGVIIKVCNSSDFYSHIAYSSACGWSINARGDEGYNTCYDYYDDEGLGYGLTYKLSLQLAEAKGYSGQPPVNVDTSDDTGSKIQQYMSQLVPTIQGESDEGRAILYKLRRVSVEDLYKRAVSSDGANDKDYWNNLEMEPIADHAGNISEVYRGYLYHGATFRLQPQIKFPEPLINGCISHDFLPLINGRFKDKYPNSDTIMYAYYIGNEVKAIKYFVDWDNFKQETTGNYETYMRVGNWSKTETVGFTGVQGYFYSSAIDDRRLVAPTVITTKIEGKDLGYDSVPFFAFDDFGSMCGVIWRNRYFTHKTNVETVNGEGLHLAVCVPYFCRNAAIHPKKIEKPEVRYTESLRMYNVQDPYTYDYWTYHFDLAWFGMRIKNPKGVPSPKDGAPVWVETVNYNPSAANDFADNGDWIGGLAADYTWLVHPGKQWFYNGGGNPPVIDQYTTSRTDTDIVTGEINFSILRQPILVNKSIPESGYFVGSPNLFGDYFYKDATAIVFGDAEYANVSEVGERTPRAYQGYTTLADHKTAHHFIGVINE